MSSLCVSIALAAALLLAACATHNTSVNKSLSGQPDRPLPRRVLLAQPDIRVHEISAGEVVEEVDEWSKKASEAAAKSIEALAPSTVPFELVQPAKLSDAERASLEQYSALYALVAGSAYGAQHSQFEAWRTRASDFDYTLGPGMGDVAKTAKLDAVVFVVGTDYISSASRKAAMALGVALAILGGGRYVGPESKPAFLSAGVVDMHTGELLWYSTELRRGSDDLRDPAVVKSLVDDLFKTYPGAVGTDSAKK
jgi:hypothetical protein